MWVGQINLNVIFLAPVIVALVREGIDVKEPKELVKNLLIDRFDLTFPVLFDTDGAVAASFAPADVLPELSRDEVMLASNLLIDPEGKVQFFSLLNTTNFDAKLVALKSRLNELL